jgi:nucleoside-diphosphate-sugar epimerase
MAVGAARHDDVDLHAQDSRRRTDSVFNHGDMYRDFTYIDDIIAGVMACLDNPPPDDGAPKAGGSLKPHRLYNIGNHRSEHLMKVVEILEAECGRKAQSNCCRCSRATFARALPTSTPSRTTWVISPPPASMSACPTSWRGTSSTTASAPRFYGRANTPQAMRPPLLPLGSVL